MRTNVTNLGPTVAASQPLAALATANERRLKMAGIKRELRAGTLTLTDVMLDPPPAIRNALLIDLVRWTRIGVRSGPGIQQLGRQALRDNVNLMLPVGKASMRSRAWVAEHGEHPLRRPNRAADRRPFDQEILQTLEHEPIPIPGGDLADLIGIPHTHIGCRLMSMSKRGLVTALPGTGRAFCWEITSRGRLAVEWARLVDGTNRGGMIRPL